MMSRSERAIFTVLVLAENEKGELLVEDRKDPDWPGVCFPGGHVEPGEAFTTAAIRETCEETGLTISDPRLVGVKQFPTKNDERYVVFFYKATKFTGTLTSSDEGEVFWSSREELPARPMVTDLLEMLKVFDSPDLCEFYYYEEDDGWGLKLL